VRSGTASFRVRLRSSSDISAAFSTLGGRRDPCHAARPRRRVIPRPPAPHGEKLARTEFRTQALLPRVPLTATAEDAHFDKITADLASDILRSAPRTNYRERRRPAAGTRRRRFPTSTRAASPDCALRPVASKAQSIQARFEPGLAAAAKCHSAFCELADDGRRVGIVRAGVATGHAGDHLHRVAGNDKGLALRLAQPPSHRRARRPRQRRSLHRLSGKLRTSGDTPTRLAKTRFLMHCRG
jgi:hypothetical protein